MSANAIFTDPCNRLHRYITTFKHSLKSLRIVDNSVKSVVDLAIRYFEDSKYYYEKGDCITGLVTISYAEGLLDALRSIGAIEWEWRKDKERIVLAAGSFDIIHPGHIEYLRWASSLGEKLYVIVSRNNTYRRIKGMDPVFDEQDRLKIVGAIKYVYQAVLGSLEDMLKPVMDVRPHIIALGPDQGVDEEYLREELRARGLDVEIIRMERRIGNYSSSNIKRLICRDVL